MSVRIAYLIDTISTDKAGTEKQLLEIIRRLDKARYDPCLIFLSTSQWIQQNTLPCRHFTLGYKGFFKPEILCSIGKLAAFIRKHDIHIVQTFFEDSIILGLLGCIFSNKNPILISSRRDMGLGIDDLWYHGYYRQALRFVNCLFNGIVTNNAMLREYVSRRERTALAKICVIPNGISLPDKCMETPAIFHEHEADLWVGIVANLKPVKRVDLFLRSLAFVKEHTFAKVHAIVLGDGRQREELETLANDLGISPIIHFMGSKQNVYEYLVHIDIGVLCSDSEGLSNAILEYMACGLPVVATGVGGSTELVDSLNGIIVPPGDPDALGTALVTIINHPSLRKDMGNVSYQRVLERYNWDLVMRQWESYYHDMLKGRV